MHIVPLMGNLKKLLDVLETVQQSTPEMTLDGIVQALDVFSLDVETTLNVHGNDGHGHTPPLVKVTPNKNPDNGINVNDPMQEQLELIQEELDSAKDARTVFTNIDIDDVWDIPIINN